MHIHRMSVDELRRVANSASALFPQIIEEHPELAHALGDIMGMVALEILVHALGGNRELAERLHRGAAARARKDD